MVLVSACLVGLNTRHDGASSPNPELLCLLRKGEAIPVCPEQLGGLPTPRPPCTLLGGDGSDVLDGKARVLDRNGQEVTPKLLRGAEEMLRVAEAMGISKAYLKEGSPSCGVEGTDRDWRKVSGPGVAAALLKRRGIQLTGVP